MKILSIESSCDETAAAVVEDGRKVLSSIVASQVEEHKLYGGVVPEIASRRHAESVSQVVQNALDEANCELADIEAIAVTYAPGLIGALLVGVNFAKGLSLSAGIPLVPTHHLRSHIAANYICHPELKPPFMCLVASGGHSHIVLVNDYTEFSIIGKTRDDAAGEALDKAARSMGLLYPGGVHLDKISKNGNKNAFSFPHPRVDNCPYDFSFSGLKTSVVNVIHNAQQKGEEIKREDLGASFQNAVVRCLISNVEKAAEDFGQTKIALAGGVSANSQLRQEMKEMCEKHSWELFVPDVSLCGDNGAMVGAQGYYEFLVKHVAGADLNAYATMSIDNLVY